jgi:tetrahydromethanopterin S-methyltransferase subunit G
VLAKEDIEFIKTHIGEWMAEQSLGKPPVVYEIELRERMVRVEEALKHQGDELKAQRELILQVLHQMDKRFEQVDKRLDQVDKRFEQTDKYIESLRHDMNKRFEQVDKRFEEITRRLDRFMFWSLGITVTCAVFVVNFLK